MIDDRGRSRAGKRAGLAFAMVAMGLLPACTTISSRDNAAAAAALTARQENASAPWRRDARAEAEAAARVRELLRDGVTAQESVAICFLSHPEVQLAFEALEISRSELVAASTPPNPVAIVGTRQPGGNLSAFYPERNVSVGVLQNVLGLVNLPSRRRIAAGELERVRIDTADRLVGLAAEVNEAYIAHAAALRIHALREDASMTARGLLEMLRQQAGDDPSSQAQLLQEPVQALQKRAEEMQETMLQVQEQLEARAARKAAAEAS